MSRNLSLFAATFLAVSIVPIVGSLNSSILAAPAPDKSVEQKVDGMNAPAAAIAKWRQLKFGLFIHWGPVSLKGTEIGWSRGGERRGRKDRGHQVPVEVYDNLYKEFNPVKFGPDEWVAIAKAAGMKYLVFTTKHHDGFVCFDSKLTDYKITSPESPYGKDIVKMLSDACHRGGIEWGVYYSPPDWHHPDYRTENHGKYIKYMHEQLRELLSNYGKVSMIFFDGLGGTAKDWDAKTLIPMCRRMQPDVIINNRCGMPADNDTPEQRIGKMQTDRPWETCMTICRQWAWKPGDNMKSKKECIQTLVRVVGGDGNLLFNVGPMPDGRIEPRQVERLKEMGQWLKQYGQTIYETRGGPFRTTNKFASTYRGKTVFLHILDDSQDLVELPPIDAKILSHKVLAGAKATIKQTPNSIEIEMAPNGRNPIDNIIVLELDKPAAEVKLGKLPNDSLAVGKKATASNVFLGQTNHYGPDKALDDDSDTRWATDAGTKSAWLEVDLGQPQTIGRARIDEAYEFRVRKYEIQAEMDGSWKTVATGTTIGSGCTVKFKPVKARKIRLNILEATEGPTIYEFALLAP
ncbi:MAG: alpha-L-fucosidase [Pirellulales bacterium]|nr:alpha-L-fucosidase [Pirellulales bacterium]